nr:hypothetical protein [Lachnospiraceae bacterium]
DIFPEAKDDSAKKQVLVDYLKEKKIGLNEKIDTDEFITQDEKKYIEYYLEDLKASKQLTKGEREAFRISAIAGDKDACDIVLQDYLVNVVDIAKLYAGQGVLVEDLVGEANIALVMALEGLWSLEHPEEVDGYFGKIAMDAMQDTIARHMDEMGENEKMVKKVEKVAKAAKNLSKLLARKVTVSELSEESKLSENYILSALKLCGNKIEEIEIPEDLK